MKVLSGIPWQLDWNFTGLSKRLTEQFTEITKRSVEVYLYTPGRRRNLDKFRIRQIPIRTLKDEDPVTSILNSIGFSHAFSNIVEKQDYDLLHCFNTTSLFLDKRPFMLQTVHPPYESIREIICSEYPRSKKYLRKLDYYDFAATLEEKEYAKATMIVASSEMAKENIARHCGIKRKLIRVIPAGVDPSICNMNYEKRKSDLKAILFPNRISVLKGFHYAAEAMREIRKAFPKSVLIVTNRIDEFESDLLKHDMEKLQKMKAVALVGYLPILDVYRYYRMADVCLVPSLYDDLSLTVLESVAHATPIVATANTGFPDVEKVGIQVPPKDPKSIAEAVITLLSDDELYAKKRQSAESVIKKYYWPNIGEKFMTIYNELVD